LTKYVTSLIVLSILSFGCATKYHGGDKAPSEVSNIPQDYEAERWPKVGALEDDLLISHYFEVKAQRQKQAHLINSWEPADGHPGQLVWRRAYYADVAAREKTVKTEMRRRKLSYNLKRKK
jgi:hypothetical protein